jgi:hypothetical protein
MVSFLAVTFRATERLSRGLDINITTRHALIDEGGIVH